MIYIPLYILYLLHPLSLAPGVPGGTPHLGSTHEVGGGPWHPPARGYYTLFTIYKIFYTLFYLKFCKRFIKKDSNLYTSIAGGNGIQYFTNVIRPVLIFSGINEVGKIKSIHTR